MLENYTAAVEFLYSNLPMFQRIGAAALKHDLSNTIKLCDALGNPQRRFQSVHIAGTNGKGSSSHMIASILQEAGYTTGLYTSPHLKDFRERIQRNGSPVPESFVVDFVNRILPHIKVIQPSFFEITVAMAFDYFAAIGVEVAVIETGLGGRLDSTNVITPLVSLITNIGWDHKDILGDTLGKIAAEKAGIIKANIPVVISEHQVGIDEVFRQRARELQSDIVFAQDHYHIEVEHGAEQNQFTVKKNNANVFTGLQLPLQGNYQQYNLAGVLATVDVLKGKGVAVGHDHIRKGLLNVVVNTHLKGRWQLLSRRPLVICDTGHNVEGIRQVIRQVLEQKYDRLFMVIGMVKDKDVNAVLRELPPNATYYFCQAKIPRALPAGELKVAAAELGLRGVAVPDVNEAIREAKRAAGADDFIFIGGSTFVVAEIENL